jgi:hypothetical protein
LRCGLHALDSNTIVHGITGIDDDLVVFCKAGFDDGFHRVAAAELYGTFLGAAVFDDEDHPLLVFAKQGTGWHLEDLVAAVDEDTCINARVVSKCLPLGERRDQVTSGRLTTARAIATRCCSPPDNCAGK